MIWGTRLDLVEVVGDGAEALVGCDLFEVRLGQEDFIVPVPVVGALEQFLPVLHDQFLVDDGAVRSLSRLFAFEGVVGGANRILRWLPSGGP